MTLEELGYKVVNSGEFGGYPYEKWKKEFSGGYEAYELSFDTCHGGHWTVECAYQWFESDRSKDWTGMDVFNPSIDWCGGKGTWHMRDIPCIDVELAEAIWQRLSVLEGERVRKKVDAEGGRR